MIVDSSALIALIFREPEAERIVASLAEAELVAIGAPTLAETAIVLAAKLGEASRAILSRLVEDLDLIVLPFTAAHGREAREAFLRFGRGRHPAALNYGDCLTYATAKLAGQPLLFVGEDFHRTDLDIALVKGT
jgi:ribonuclease VapC